MTDSKKDYYTGFMAGVMAARGQILQVRDCDFKHEALDKLDEMLLKMVNDSADKIKELKDDR